MVSQSKGRNYHKKNTEKTGYTYTHDIQRYNWESKCAKMGGDGLSYKVE